MRLSDSDASDLRKQILLGFHTQFAENQRSREGSFLQFLALLGALAAGYAFLLRQEPSGTADPLHPATLMLFQAAAAAVLFVGAQIVVTISNNFRRDQHVNVRIRKACGLVGADAIFPESYDPAVGLRKWGPYSWMPDMLSWFYWLFILFQLGALLAFVAIVKLWVETSVTWPENLVITFSGGLLIWALIITPRVYLKKLVTVIRLDPESRAMLDGEAEADSNYPEESAV